MKGCVVKMLRTSFSTKGEWDPPKKSKTHNRFCAKLISGAVSAMMVLSMVPVGMTSATTALAKLEGTTYTILKTGDTLEASSFGDDAGEKNKVTRVVFENESGVTTINDGAFKDLTSLEEIDFSNATKLTPFELNKAGANKDTLKTVIMPNGGSIDTISDTLFTGCTALETIVFPEKSPVTTIAAGAFKDLTALKNINIPANVTKIDNSTFEGCKTLETLALPKKVTEIGSSAFSGCKSLNNIDISNVESIGASAFANCSALTNINLNAKVDTIADSIFEGCAKLECIVIPESVTTIGKNAFSGCKALAGLNIPKAVATIDTNAFDGCKALANVSFDKESKLDTINDSVFKDCQSLDNVVLPENVVTIKENAFSNCDSLKIMNLSKNKKLKTIAQQAFSDCDALKEVYIPNSVETIEANAFDSCVALARVAFEAGAKVDIPNNAFNKSENITEVINLPSESSSSAGANKNAFAACANVKYYNSYKDDGTAFKTEGFEGSWNGIVGSDSANLTASELPQNKYYDAIKNFTNKYEESVVLNLSLVDGTNNPVEEVKEVYITLKFNDKLPNTIEKVFHEKADGNIEELEVQFSSDKQSIIFKTTSFSNFILVGKEKSTPAPAQPEQGSSTSNNETSAAKAEDNKEASKVAAKKGTSTSKAVKTGDNSVMVASGLAIIMLSAIGCWLFITKKVKD